MLHYPYRELNLRHFHVGGSVSRAWRLCKKTLGSLVVLSFLVFCTATNVQAQQSPDVHKKIVEALKLIDKNQWTKAEKIIKQTDDPFAEKLYYWALFKEGRGRKHFDRLMRFVRDNPDWPNISDIRREVELALTGASSDKDVIEWFNDYPPRTAKALDIYVQALLRSGKEQDAKVIIAEWWSDTLLPRNDQRFLYKKYKKYLDESAHAKRLDTLLHAGQYTNGRAIARVLGRGYLKLAEARIALAAQKGNVDAKIKAVPQRLQSDAGLTYERLRWRRRKGLDLRAIEILLKPPAVSKISNPKDWWRERHIIIRRLLEEKKYKQAYIIAAKHIQTSGFAYAQAEWISGWLALRFLDDPTRAYEHFEEMYANVSSPISRSRAAYWAGLAAKDCDQEILANGWFEKASEVQTTFYGQLAGAELGLKKVLPNAKPPVLSAADLKEFKAHEFVKAAQAFHDAGMREQVSVFLNALVKKEKTPKIYRFAAEWAADIDHQHDSVRIAKKATKEGMFLTAQSYPIIPSRLKHIDLEWALIHSIIRQESLFDYKAKSPAGAVGLMQLLPSTARYTAKKIGVQHRTSWLTRNPDHNILIGSAYLEELLNQFQYSYPMAIAAYNAGPTRVHRWIKQFGDPRKGEIDWIDWIELIPIYETRNYVQRVMENVYVYRLRLRGIQKKPKFPIHIAMISGD